MERNWPKDRQVVLEFAGFQVRKKSYDSALSIVSRAFDNIGNVTEPRFGDMTGRNASAMISQKIMALTIYREAYAGANKLKEALASADELMKLDPSNSERRFEKTKLLIRMNRIKEAKKELTALRTANYPPAEELCKKYLDN
ncbi:MAG TPA: tetratricopeptide repeat protein [Cyclobacteriaceae bacterium]|nr:tetratricopeptide repeat protein [Cyclobacteriaceae bacterium]